MIKRTPAAAGAMWNWTPAKKAVESLFWTGEGAALRHQRLYLLITLETPCAGGGLGGRRAID